MQLLAAIVWLAFITGAIWDCQQRYAPVPQPAEEPDLFNPNEDPDDAESASEPIGSAVAA